MLESKSNVKPKMLCRVCKTETSLRSIHKDLKRYIYNTKKANAKREGIEFNILFEDIVFPLVCPVLGVELKYPSKALERTTGQLPNSPSFDRLDISKGYVKGNVIIVSTLANRIRSDASPEQILKVGTYYLELLTPTNGTVKNEC